MYKDLKMHHSQIIYIYIYIKRPSWPLWSLSSKRAGWRKETLSGINGCALHSCGSQISPTCKTIALFDLPWSFEANRTSRTRELALVRETLFLMLSLATCFQDSWPLLRRKWVVMASWRPLMTSKYQDYFLKQMVTHWSSTRCWDRPGWMTFVSRSHPTQRSTWSTRLDWQQEYSWRHAWIMEWPPIYKEAKVRFCSHFVGKGLGPSNKSTLDHNKDSAFRSSPSTACTPFQWSESTSMWETWHTTQAPQGGKWGDALPSATALSTFTGNCFSRTQIWHRRRGQSSSCLWFIAKLRLARSPGCLMTPSHEHISMEPSYVSTRDYSNFLLKVLCRMTK